ncbi:peptidyl-prolyl cis-trans isomerase FKBP17-1, chloroplastic-like isoform X2 [Musa acuminata AAA Group]|uniref:peptidyl-prolyl cis-trans isomerase FKBP17-1, chloroplastic-like isoform X2 n=1 Tax=Musa acuminata AAA Group TaxID=214697 RepID=UPI0031DED30E
MGTALCATLSASPLSSSNPHLPPKPVTPLIPRLTTRRSLLASSAAFLSSVPLLDLPPSAAAPPPSPPAPSAPAFFEIPGSGGVKALDLRVGSGETPIDGDQVSIHYYGRLAAKQGWRFDSTYDHKDTMGDPVPFLFVLGSGKFFDRQRLFTTIFNPTRLANGEGSTLGTLIFDIELVSSRHS